MLALCPLSAGCSLIAVDRIVNLRGEIYVVHGRRGRMGWYRVGDSDNFRLYHTPGIGWFWPLRALRMPDKGVFHLSLSAPREKGFLGETNTVLR